MCLILKSNDSKVHISDEDIVCYKVVERMKKSDHKRYYSASTEKYISSYAKLNNVHIVARYERNNRVVKEDDFIKGVMIDNHEYIESTITDGAIHSFVNLDDAICARAQHIAYFRWVKKHNYAPYIIDREYFVVKCIIPKGTPYYIGINGLNEKNYASREIIYQTIIDI